MQPIIGKLSVTVSAYVLLAGSAATLACAQDIFVGSITNLSSENVIRQYTDSGSFVRQFDTGGALPGFRPYALTLGADGMLYAADNNGTGLARFNPASGSYLGTVGTMSDHPLGLALGPDGSLYVSGNNHNLFRVNPATNSTALLFNPGFGAYSFTFRPDNGHLLLPNATNGGTVEEYDVNTGTHVGTFATGLDIPTDIMLGPDGRYYILENDSRIKVVGPTGGAATLFATGNRGGVSIELGYDGVGSYFTPSNQATVEEFDATSGAFTATFPSPGGYGIAIQRVAPAAATPEPGPLALLAGCLLPASLALRQRRRAP